MDKLGDHFVRICTVCGKRAVGIEELDELFHKQSDTNDGYRSICKECRVELNEQYRHSFNGLMNSLYNGQVDRAKKREMDLPTYTKEEFVTWINNHPNFEKLYQDWKDSEYDLWVVPSVDRLDDYKSYTFDNIRLVTWKENHERISQDQINGFNNKVSISVNQYDLWGNYINSYYSIANAGRENNCSASRISACCNGKQISCDGYLWCHKKSDNQNNLEILPNEHKIVCQFNSNGELVGSYLNQVDAENQTGIFRTNISGCILGKRETAGDFFWYNKSDVTDNTKQEILDRKPKHGVFQFTKSGEFVESYMNPSQASEETGVSRKGIGKCIKGLLESSGTFVWKSTRDGFSNNDISNANKNVVS